MLLRISRKVFGPVEATAAPPAPGPETTLTTPKQPVGTVQLEQLHKTYPGASEATVKGVDLTIEHGEFFILLGPSGCGKSTLLRMIAGLEAISGGSLAIGGQRVNDVAPKDRDIAMVFQSYALYPHMTVRENLGFGLKMRGTSKDEIAKRIEEVAPILGLETLLDRQPKALSGGQRQRVALGRAIVREPKVFLLDEPLSNLDAKLRGSMRGELKRLHQRLKTTMIYVTHDQTEAMTLGDRVAVMNDGVLQQVGTPLEVYDQPANRFVAGFLGSPPMNFLPGALTASGLKLQCGSDVALPERLAGAAPEGTAVELGIRPEDLRVSEQATALTGTVAVIEPLGAETIVTVDTPAGPVVARLEPGQAVTVGGTLSLEPDPARVHLFAQADGHRVGPAPARHGQEPAATAEVTE
jgi:multiple sugar transport system ATP-binding protein